MNINKKVFFFLLAGAVGGHLRLAEMFFNQAAMASTTVTRLMNQSAGGGGADCTANCTFTGTTVEQDAGFSGSVTINKELNVLGDGGVAKNLHVQGDAGIMGAVTVNGVLTSGVTGDNTAIAFASNANAVLGTATIGSDSGGTALQFVTANSNSTHQFFGGGLQVAASTLGKAVNVTSSAILGWATTDNSGTPGNTTISKGHGCGAIANGASSITVTNTLVTTASSIFTNVQDATDAIYVKSVVPSSGSFVITMSGVTTGARKICWFVIN